MKKKIHQNRLKRKICIVFRLISIVLILLAISTMMPSIIDTARGPVSIITLALLLLNNIPGLIELAIGLGLILITLYISETIHNTNHNEEKDKDEN